MKGDKAAEKAAASLRAIEIAVALMKAGIPPDNTTKLGLKVLDRVVLKDPNNPKPPNDKDIEQEIDFIFAEEEMGRQIDG